MFVNMLAIAGGNTAAAVYVIAGLFIAVIAAGQWALSTNRVLSFFTPQYRLAYPVKAAVTIYQGASVGLDPAGYAKPFVAGDKWVGLAYDKADNASGAAGAINVRIYSIGDPVLPFTAVAITDIGRPVFATADDTYDFTGHTDAFVGYLIGRKTASEGQVRLKRAGELPPNGVGNFFIDEVGEGEVEATGAASTSKYVRAMIHKSILGLGVYQTNAADGGLTLEFDAVAEVALSSIRQSQALFPVSKGITLEVWAALPDKGDNVALDIDMGLGTALTTNSEANIDHADMVDLAAFHSDGNDASIFCQSDDNTTDVANTDTALDFDTATPTYRYLKIVVRPSGSVEFWVDGARVLSTTTFAVRNTVNLAPFVNMEKTSDDTTAKLLVKRIRACGGKTSVAAG